MAVIVMSCDLAMSIARALGHSCLAMYFFNVVLENRKRRPLSWKSKVGCCEGPCAGVGAAAKLQRVCLGIKPPLYEVIVKLRCKSKE